LEQRILAKMQNVGSTVGSIATEIFVGVQTSADKVYILKKMGVEGDRVNVFSKSTQKSYWLERGILRNIISGTDVQRYGTPEPENVVIFPYDVDAMESSARLLTSAEFLERFPRTWEYLNENRDVLAGRENGRMLGERWYAYVYPKNLAKQSLPKLCVPRLVNRLCAVLDEAGEYCLDNVDVGGITVDPRQVSPRYLLAVLNSTAADFFLKSRSTRFRGGFTSANKQFLSTIPVPTPAALSEARRERAQALDGLVSESIANDRHYRNLIREFDALLQASLPADPTRNSNFANDYYGRVQFWASRRLIPEGALQLTERVTGIRVDDLLDTVAGLRTRLTISYRSGNAGSWKPLVELHAVSEELACFVVLAFTTQLQTGRLSLARSTRLRRTVDQVLNAIVLPTWPLAGTTDAQLSAVRDLMTALRTRVPGELSLSAIVAQKQSLEAQIDQIVMDLYGLSDDEQRFLLQLNAD
jgi:hypothetical protein